MKSRQPISAKRYRIVFGKLQAGVFALILLASMGACFSLGYFWGARGASSEVAKAERDFKVLKKNKDALAQRGAVFALKQVPETPETKTEAPNKTTDVIKPKFYQDLLKENLENVQPIDPIELPVVRKKILPKPTTPPLAATVEKPPEKQVDEKKAGPKQDNTNRIVQETEKRAEANPRASKPWAKEDGYTIQVVSVKKFDEALRVVRMLRDAGFQPFIKNVELGARGKWYRVRVGNYRDKAEAQKVLSDMQVRLKLQRARILSM